MTIAECSGPGPAATVTGEAGPSWRSAWSASFLGGLGRATAGEVLRGATECSFLAGDLVFGGPHGLAGVSPTLVVSGLFRISVSVPDGRELAIGHASTGSVVGLAEMMMGEHPADRTTGGGDAGVDVRAECLQDARVLVLSADSFRELVGTRADLAGAVARHLAREKVTTERSVAHGLFLPVRARVAHHLLEVAEQDGRLLVARTSHREIANAVGSVREVVSRVLRVFQDERLVMQDGRRLILVDSAGLLEVA